MSKNNLPRNEDGTLQKWTFPGCYPIYYIDNKNNVLCADCANAPGYSTEPVAADVNYEDAHLYCDDCSKRIESAYAEDDAEQD